MGGDGIKTLVAAVVAFVASGLAAPIVLNLLKRAKSRQTISEYVPEHAVKQGTPTMGGLMVVIGLIAGILAGRVDGAGYTLGLVAWFAFIGFLDDYWVPRMIPGKRGLGWMPKLGMEIVPILALWCMQPRTPLGVIALMGFSILFFANAYNFADGMDGLAGGVGIVFALGLMMMGSRSSVELISLVMALVPFLFLNAPPAKVFMGDVGSLPIGALFGLVFVESTVFHDPNRADWALLGPGLLASLLLILEIVPVPLQVASAKLRKGKRLFPFKTPIHHGFEAGGWPESRVVWSFILFQFVCSVFAVGWYRILVDSRGQG